MAQRGDTIPINDFSGGLNTFDPEYLSPLNQSPDLDNITLLTKGWKKRQGDVAFNSTAMVSSATAVVGGGYIKFDSGTEFINAIAGTKFFTSSGLTGTMADATGAITITSDPNNIWMPVNFNNLQIWFGGAPDAPFKYSGTGNAAALGGSPPSAYTAFAANNRIFAISTTAYPSRIYWPILSNPEDWTGTGSGNTDVGMSDGEPLLTGQVLSADTAILFKNSSTHLMVLTRAPFPIYQLQKGIGAAGRYCVVSVKGTLYFITPSKRMKATNDGINFIDFPNDINDIWDSINSTRVQYIQGVYYQQLEQIHWYVSTGSSTNNNYCIIWDLPRKCWLRNTKGFKVNVPFVAQNRRLFGCHCDGKIYEKDYLATYTDASETAPGAIDAYWRTPYKGDLSKTIHPLYIDVSCLSQTAGNITVSYLFDFGSIETAESFSMVSSSSLWDTAVWDTSTWGGQTATIKRIFTVGRGNLMSLKVRNNAASVAMTIQGIDVVLRTDRARKAQAVT